MFTWDQDRPAWKAVSGADPAPSNPVQVDLQAIPGVEAPLSVYDVIVGTALTAEYLGTETPSLPPCGTPSRSAAPSS